MKLTILLPFFLLVLNLSNAQRVPSIAGTYSAHTGRFIIKLNAHQIWKLNPDGTGSWKSNDGKRHATFLYGIRDKKTYPVMIEQDGKNTLHITGKNIYITLKRVKSQ
ncbi:MAG: hypothetical protein H0W62_06170 [Chitinophagales bacterium]|nr:hypothetical protein [Chitinophagales bacterium]